MLHIGTSGFSYDDWVGPVYPAGLPKRDWLAFYAREFSTVEVNATYYAIPAPKTLAAMADKTPAGFLFTVKANQEMTHKRGDNASVFAAFKLAVQPMVDAGKLGCILAQFPFSFHATAPNRQYLAEAGERLAPLPLVAEFRNREWLSPETFADLRRLGIGFCCVDEPRLPGLIPPVAEATVGRGLRALPRPQRRQVVGAQGGLRAVRLLPTRPRSWRSGCRRCGGCRRRRARSFSSPTTTTRARPWTPRGSSSCCWGRGEKTPVGERAGDMGLDLPRQAFCTVEGLRLCLAREPTS